MNATAPRRLRIVRVLVQVETAIDDGADLHVQPMAQPVAIPTLAAFQEFATIGLPSAIAAEEARLNAPDRANGVALEAVPA